MVFHRSLSDNKSPQVSRTLLSILADHNNNVVWMVSIRPVIFKSFSSCTHPLVTVSRAPITIGITVTFMFHSFFQFPSKVEVFIFFFSLSFNFNLRSTRTAKSTILQVLIFYFCSLLSGLVVWLRLSDPFVSQILEEFVRLIHSS